MFKIMTSSTNKCILEVKDVEDLSGSNAKFYLKNTTDLFPLYTLEVSKEVYGSLTDEDTKQATLENLSIQFSS